jgi:hypothetical protein
MAADDKIILTADEAISLLPAGDDVHNYVNNIPGIFIGCDFSRADAEKHIRSAVQCEIGGSGCKGMKHALVVWATNNRMSFFATDMAKVEEMERAKETV